MGSDVDVSGSWHTHGRRIGVGEDVGEGDGSLGRAGAMGDVIERGCLTARLVAAAVVFLVLAIPTVLFFGFILLMLITIPILFLLALF